MIIEPQTADRQVAKYTYSVSVLYLSALMVLGCSRAPVPGKELKERQRVTGEAVKKSQQPRQPTSTESSAVARGQDGVPTYTAKTPNLNQTSAIRKRQPDLDVPTQRIPLVSVMKGRHAKPINEVLAPQDLLQAKLATPTLELSATQGISLIGHCAQLGEENAASATDKDVVMVLGNAGVGKSTFLNALLGCKMKLVKPSEINLDGVRKVVVVDSNNGHNEIMLIGHDSSSKTFMPQIALEPNNSDGGAYCDCPGFSDTRGEEINIANAINIRRILQQAQGVKAVFLANYSDFAGRRCGNDVQIFEKACVQLFGGIDNLKKHKNAVLLGITKAPRHDEDGEPITHTMVRALLTRTNGAIMQILANRFFLYDPLDRGRDNTDFWSLERCRNEIAGLGSIPKSEATALFQTVLTGDDEIKLKLIMREQVGVLVQALERGNYQAAGNHWQSLARLRIIENGEVETLLKELVLDKINHYASGCIGTFKKYASQYQFDQAEQQLSLLQMLQSCFPNANLQLDLPALKSLLTKYKEKRAEEQRNTDKMLDAATRQAVQEVREEMEAKIQQMLRQLQDVLPQTNFSESEQSRILAQANADTGNLLNSIGKH